MASKKTNDRNPPQSPRYIHIYSDSRLVYGVSHDLVEMLLSEANKCIQNLDSYYFGDLSFNSCESMPNQELMLYFAAFALGTLSIKSIVPFVPSTELGEALFHQAQNNLKDRWDTLEFQDIPALALMALYLTAVDQQPKASILLSHALSICCLQGRLKNLRRQEKDIRIVWTVICLAKETANLMEQPFMYADEAFQLPRPQDVL